MSSYFEIFIGVTDYSDGMDEVDGVIARAIYCCFVVGMSFVSTNFFVSVIMDTNRFRVPDLTHNRCRRSSFVFDAQSYQG